MKDMKIDGRTERCFILKDDAAATIVIPISKLMPVDFRRLRDIENKGGEMMQQMRDANLDNGRNAIKQYEPLFVIVRKESFDERKEQEITEQFDPAKAETTAQQPTTEEQPKRRGPGRPKGSTSKKKANSGAQS